MPSESEAPLPSDEPLQDKFDDLATCSNAGDTEMHQKAPDENRIVKRPREAMPRSRSLTPKRNRTSPPALKQMSYYNETLKSIKTKSEPEDFDLSEDPYFINQQLEQYLNPQTDSSKGELLEIFIVSLFYFNQCLMIFMFLRILKRSG